MKIDLKVILVKQLTISQINFTHSALSVTNYHRPISEQEKKNKNNLTLI